MIRPSRIPTPPGAKMAMKPTTSTRKYVWVPSAEMELLVNQRELELVLAMGEWLSGSTTLKKSKLEVLANTSLLKHRFSNSLQPRVPEILNKRLQLSRLHTKSQVTLKCRPQVRTAAVFGRFRSIEANKSQRRRGSNHRVRE